MNAFEEGRQARLQGHAMLSNPFPILTEKRQEWWRGWLAEDQELRGVRSCVME